MKPFASDANLQTDFHQTHSAAKAHPAARELPTKGFPTRERLSSYSAHSLETEHSTSHSHVHSEESLRKIVNRLSRLEGHIRGIKTMVRENRPCPDVLMQVAAVRGGIDRVARVILDEHLSECMTRAAQAGDIEAEIDALKTALDRFF